MLSAAFEHVPMLSCQAGLARPGQRSLPEEVPVALTYGGITHAVMMTTPVDLEDFALGFSYAEGIVDRADQLDEIEIVTRTRGIELRMWLSPERSDAFGARRRSLAGAVGCGLCGLESLDQATPRLPVVLTCGAIRSTSVPAALLGLADQQSLNRKTRAVHAAALWDCRTDELIAVREDVGRHNALDKLAGHVIRTGGRTSDTALVLTSRISVELVQKAARLGVPILIGVSAPTGLAVRSAMQAGITLIGIARGDGFEVFSGHHRIHWSC